MTDRSLGAAAARPHRRRDAFSIGDLLHWLGTAAGSARMITRVRWLRCVVSILVLTCLLTSTQADAEGRIALVVGNANYEHVPALANPTNDAADISQALQRLGFRVTTVRDANFESLRRALLEFGRATSGADMAVMFFAGHGIEVTGENWLLPVDSLLKNDSDVDTDAISLRSAILAVSNASRLGLVILDACRNNPFALKTRKVTPARTIDFGLAPVKPTENVLVAYAAQDGTTANDGTGRNSPYTTALLHHIETPGLEVEFLFRNVRDDVIAATNYEQQPFVYGSLSREDIYLKEGQPVVVATGSPDEMSEAGEIAWSFLQLTSDVGTLRRFVEQFPASSRLSDAKLRIAALERAGQPQVVPPTPGFVLASATPADVNELDVHTTQSFHENTPAVEEAWKLVKDTTDVSVIRRFANRFPSRERRAAVDRRLAALGGQGGVAPSFTRDMLIKAATDEDVLRCFRIDDMKAPECRLALDRYPQIWQFTYDFRFRFALCRSLGSDCRDINGMMRDAVALQAKALFSPNNAGPVQVNPAAPSNVQPADRAFIEGNKEIRHHEYELNRHHKGRSNKTDWSTKHPKSTTKFVNHANKFANSSPRTPTVRAPTIRTPTIRVPTIPIRIPH